MESSNIVLKVLNAYLDREKKTRLKDLLKFFCNHVFLGQWELAKCAIPTLVANLKVSEKQTDFVDILTNVADFPFSQSLGSTTIPTPHHLSWLCLLELKQLFANCKSERAKEIEKLEQDIDFRMTLAQLKDVDEKLIQEIYVYFRRNFLKLSSPLIEDDIDSTDILPQAAIGEIKKVMLTKPCLGDSIVKVLMVEKKGTDGRDVEMLHSVYINCINNVLDNIEAAIKHGLGSDDLQQLSDHMMLILALHDPMPYWNYLQLRQLFTRLLHMCYSENLPSLSVERLVSVLCRQNSSYLLDEVCKIYQEVSMLTLRKGLDHELELLTDSQKSSLVFLRRVDRDACWRDFFIANQKQQTHFLGNVVDLCLALIRGGKFMELQDVLSYPELQPLKTVVLLIGWSQCNSSQDIRTLFDTLWDDVPDNSNPVLTGACRKLAYHLDLIEWCLERSESFDDDSDESVTSPVPQSTELLRDLESHSMLHILQHSTSLGNLDHTEILHLLMNMPTDKGREPKKSVTFQDQSKQSGTTQSKPVNVEQMKDVSIFRSYCVLKNVMDVLLFCVENMNHDLMDPVQVKRAVKARTLQKNFMDEHPPSSSEGEDSSSPGLNGESRHLGMQAVNKNGDADQFFKLYDNSVTKKLQEGKDHLRHIQPLTYRLEVLEDVFSLLFVTHEDLTDMMTIQDSGDENDDSKQGSSVDLYTQDSLNLSVQSEEETTLEDTSPKQQTKLPPLSPVVTSPQPTSTSGASYDEPFISPFEKHKPLSPQTEVAESSYFTMDPESKKKSEDLSKKKLQEEAPVITRKTKRRRKRESCSEQTFSPVGFLANEYLVRDILHLLKEAISDLNTARYALSGKSSDSPKRDIPKSNSAVVLDPQVEKALQESMKTSIAPDTLQKRIAKLTQAIHEAWWRFQLVAHEMLPRQPGRILKEKIVVMDNEINSLPYYVSDGNRKHSASGSSMFEPKANIVSKMMATPESLLVLCLVKSNITQAAEVIKLFRLTDKTPETCEVTFAELYHSCSTEIWDLEIERRDANPAPIKVGRRSVKALSKAAAVGVATASLSHIVEDLLGKTSLPVLPLPKTVRVKESYSHLFNLDVSSALLFDLLCTSCKTWDTCNNMLDIMKARMPKLLGRDPRHSEEQTISPRSESDSCPEGDSLSPVTTSSASPMSPPPLPGRTSKSKNPIIAAAKGVVGCSNFVWTLHDLVQIEEAGTGSASSIHSPPLAKIGLQQRFNSASSSLKASSLRATETALFELNRALDRVVQALAGVNQGQLLDIVTDDVQHSPSPSPRGSISGGSFSGSTNTSSTSGAKPPSKSQELSVAHSAFRQLMYTMEKRVPSEGWMQLLLGKETKGLLPPVKNFLLSMFEHVREMAHLVSECEGRSKELLENYFKVLDDGPISVLGRLMFVKRMPPAKLEVVAEKLSLNLTHTIVYSCCPKIPSKHRARPIERSEEKCKKVNGTRVVNDQVVITPGSDQRPERKHSAPGHPEVIVREILSEFVEFMRSMASRMTAQGVFDLTCAKNALQQPEYSNFTAKIQKLANLDLRLLQSDEEKLSFYANMANLMLIHCHLDKIQGHLEVLRRLEEDGGASPVPDDHAELLPFGAADNMIYLSGFSYSIGQLGVVSAYDILNIFCRTGLGPRSQWKSVLACRQFDLSPEDPWKVFAPPSEPKLAFVINTGCTSSPPVKILAPETIQQQLEQAMKDYLSHTVTVSVEKEQVSLPELVMWHERDFVSEEVLQKDTRHAALVKWAAEYVVNSEKQSQLQQLFHLDSVHGFSENIDVSGKIELPFQVQTDRFDNTYSIAFDVSNVKVGSTFATTSSMSRKAATFSISNSMERSYQGLNLELPTYNLTPVTLEYVKHDSLLIATMVSLVCADNLDNIEQQFTDDHFNMMDSNSNPQTTRKTRAFSDISLVDIRSYRYQRLTNDYPILQRHLLHYILPLAGADNPELFESREPILKFVTNDIDDQVKLCMFSLPSSNQFQGVIQDMGNRLVEERKWSEILNILNSLPRSVIQEFTHLQLFHDFAVSCWALSSAKAESILPGKVISALWKFYNPSVQARTILTVWEAIPLDTCLDLLDQCLNSLDQDLGLLSAVTAKKRQISVYIKIMTCAKNLQLKLSMKDIPVTSMTPEDKHLHGILTELADWRGLSKFSQCFPEDLITILERSGDFTTAREWAEIHALSQEHVKEIRKRHMKHLLTKTPPDMVTAFQILDNVRSMSEADCFSLCQELADSLTGPAQIKFVLSYMLQFLTSQILPEDVEDLRLRRIGAKALMCIPDNLLEEYSHLISSPHLILEQLLMNMKAELAGQIFEDIKLDFAEVREPKLRMAQDQFNNLLTTYALKAVEVKVAQVVGGKSRSESANSNGSSRHEDDFDTSKRYSDRLKTEMAKSPTSSVGSYSSSRQDALTRSVARHSVNLGTASTRESSKKTKGQFVMPVQPPSQDQWVPDDATSVCMVCKVERFSMFNRRHHCRRCGRVVCAACSTKQSMVFGVMGRTCDECYEQMNSENRAQEEHEIYSQRIRDRLSEAGTSVSPSGRNSLPFEMSPGMLREHRRKRPTMASAIHHESHEWKLKPDVTFSDMVRAEFYYEQAPSVSLCISLLKQHSSRLESGKQILSLCDTLSSHLVPISPGVPNPEIDYSLIISVMKQLLFQAKLDFLHCGDSSMVHQSDLYLGRIDLLGVMVMANYQDLPTLKELTKSDTVRRLRDKLIADERLSLAMEVSTKCGIDPAGVWTAMGFACLNAGDYQGAREKFGRCLKVPNDKNQTSASQSRLLGEIVEFLDAIPSNGLTEVQRMLKDPASICDLKTLLVPSVGEENNQESVPYKECLFYLKTYGSYMDYISFLRQHGYWMKAVQFTVDRRCLSDVFVNGLLVPAMTSGDLGRLLDQMLMLDPTLDKWIPYLTASCKYMLKHKYFYTLYQLQLFMKDFIRAAMTCISHFFQRGAQSYLDLSGRLQFLFTAQQHLQAYLDPSQWGSVHHPLAPSTPPRNLSGPSWERTSSEQMARMTLTPDEVTKHIRTVALQIEVTKFLEQCLTQAMTGAPVTNTKFTTGPNAPQLPTLFGNSAARTELISMVLLSGTNFSASFDLALRIVKECRLNPTINFTHCSRELARQGRFSEITTLIQQLIREEMVGDEAIDEIVGASLLVIADSHSQSKDESDALIHLLRNESNKINAYILCGKLRSAYLLAVKRDSVEDVQRIAGAAQRLGQAAVRNICRKWLEQRQK